MYCLKLNDRAFFGKTINDCVNQVASVDHYQVKDDTWRITVSLKDSSHFFGREVHFRSPSEKLLQEEKDKYAFAVIESLFGGTFYKRLM
jgi:hypothetical protein